MYDEDESDPAGATDAVIVDLQYAYDRYIGPHAMVESRLLPAIPRQAHDLHLPQGRHTDWNRVRQTVNSWEDPPLLIYQRYQPAIRQRFRRLLRLGESGQSGLEPNGSNWGEQYLDNFYQTMMTQYPNKIAVGAAWPGFNDSRPVGAGTAK